MTYTELALAEFQRREEEAQQAMGQTSTRTTQEWVNAFFIRNKNAAARRKWVEFVWETRDIPHHNTRFRVREMYAAELGISELDAGAVEQNGIFHLGSPE